MKNTITASVLFMLSINGNAQAVNEIVQYWIPEQQEIENNQPATVPEVSNDKTVQIKSAIKNSKAEFILKVLDVFGDLSMNEIYQVTLAADVPDNKRPAKVFYKNEPGHVFIILEKKDTITNQSIAKVWGFYPVKPVSCVLFKKTKSVLTDNGKREYNAAITKTLSKEEFKLVKQKAAALAEKKYHINQYNCYDYAIEIFNSLPGIESIPVTHVKFPFIFGRGGSPCGLYADLVKLKNSNSAWARFILIGNFTAPESFVSTSANIISTH